jgi:hypothetical protein
VKYWAYLLGKLAAIAGAVLVLHACVVATFPPPPVWIRSNFLYDMPYTFCVFGVWLVGAGLLTLAVRDQRSRCRTCLHRLVMPIATGSWSNFLTLGRPTTEWICPFGHGTLRIDEVQITGKESPDWRPHDDDIWKELESYYQARK